ncbi:MAG: TATA-box-binding protein [Candidatus Aenigmarchaeota archaeon]|nr:TATA-box-binding protein [Candidatus Aenigmarchaeota archaeon]
MYALNTHCPHKRYLKRGVGTAKDIRIENVVASATLNVKVPLNKLVAKVAGTEYEPEQFPGLVYRMKEPKAASLIFTSGKVVCTGAHSPALARKAMGKVIEAIKSIGVEIKDPPKIRIENIVASARIEGTLKLNEIAFQLPNAEYEPEQFPGLVYRMEDPNVAFLLFGSGKIVCTGGRNVADVEKAINKIERELKRIGALERPVKK